MPRKGRRRNRPSVAKWKFNAMSMKGMMGKKIRKLMKHNAYTEEQAKEHWLANRRRGMTTSK